MSVVASERTVKSSTSTCWIIISNGSVTGLTVTSDSMDVPFAHGSTRYRSFV